MEKLNKKDLEKFRKEIKDVCQKHGRDMYVMVFSSQENVFNDKNRDEDVVDSLQVAGFKDPAFCGHAIRKILFMELIENINNNDIKVDANHLHMFSSFIHGELEYYNRVLYTQYRKEVGNPIK